MKNFYNRFTPLIFIISGIYLVAIPYLLPIENEFPFTLIDIFSQGFITAGIVMYAFQIITTRLSRIEKQLDISKENNVTSFSLISSDNQTSFLDELRKSRFAYKASIYLPNSNIESLFFLKSFLNSIKLDSKARIVINISEINLSERRNITDILSKYHNQIELRYITSKSNQNFSIVILDTTIWVLANFGEEIQNSLIFSVSINGDQGRSYIDFYNKVWNESTTIKSLPDAL